MSQNAAEVDNSSSTHDVTRDRVENISFQQGARTDCGSNQVSELLRYVCSAHVKGVMRVCTLLRKYSLVSLLVIGLLCVLYM